MLCFEPVPKRKGMDSNIIFWSSKMSETQIVVLFIATFISLSCGLVIGLLKKIQRRSEAHDSKITEAIEQDNPFSL